MQFMILYKRKINEKINTNNENVKTPQEVNQEAIKILTNKIFLSKWQVH